MIKALIGIRFRALLAGLTAQSRKKNKNSTGTVILFVILYLYLIAVIGGVMCLTFYTLAEAYHAMGLDWLYFSMAGLMGLSMAVIGSVFTTQSQLYDAKDNHMLLSMPIPPRLILFSRILPLLALNLLFAGIVMIPAIVMYAVFVKFSLLGIVLQILALLAVCILAQAIACLFGWFLHLLLSRMNKSLVSVLYLIVFLGLYFAIYSRAGNILQALALNGEALAGTIKSWVWPLYAMGHGCLGSAVYLIGFVLICAAAFGLVYWILSATFLRTATASRSRKRRKLDMDTARVSSPIRAIVIKEWRKFLGCPVYLTNMGMGVFLTAALPVAGLIFRDTILQVLTEMVFLSPAIPLIICAMLAFTVSTACVSTPSVSLEGKNLWILKSLPVLPGDILKGKLYFHCLMTVPVSALAGLILAITFGCSLPDVLLSALIPGLLSLFSGLWGLWAGLQWAKLDYISEAYPCKQSVSVVVSMFGMMGFVLILGFSYLPLSAFMNPTIFLCLCAVVLAAACWGLYRIIAGWGVKKWNTLQA